MPCLLRSGHDSSLAGTNHPRKQQSTRTVNPPTIDDFMRHADSLYRFAVSKTHDHHAAQDLVQDTLVTAWQKAETFRGGSALSTWLFGIMKFKVMNHFRKSARTPTDRAVPPGDGEDGQDPMDLLFDKNGSWKIDPNHRMEFLADEPDEKAWHQEILAKVRECLDRLPERLRLLFTLREVDRMDVPSAAAAAGVTVGSAAVLLTRSRQRLRLCLQENNIEP